MQVLAGLDDRAFETRLGLGEAFTLAGVLPLAGIGARTLDGVLRMDNATFQSLQSETKFTSIDIATNGHDLVRLRSDRAPGKDERVRKAFKLATDRKALYDRVQLSFGAVGRDTPIGPLYKSYYTEEFAPPGRGHVVRRRGGE